MTNFSFFFCVKPDIYKNTPLYLAAASPVMQKDNGLRMTAVPVLPGISFPLRFVSKSIFIIPSFFDFGLQAERCGPLHGHKKSARIIRIFKSGIHAVSSYLFRPHRYKPLRTCICYNSYKYRKFMDMTVHIMKSAVVVILFLIVNLFT